MNAVPSRHILFSHTPPEHGSLSREILLVDDSPTLLMSITSVLERNGYAVTRAASAEDGLAQMRTHGFGLVIADYHMPGMNGVEMIRQARRLPAMRFTPILLLSNDSGHAARAEARAAGATGWLLKPVSAADLMQVLGQVIPDRG
ncbi:Response regulator [Rhodovastum atsumiense]|uniref:Response regulator n=1 Tax=Rhodovastum atsumiense TaxID=504468 RepID=A0A5M6ILN3_9PROT|nr:response regulator [Rhodovastum atsumiense]KAA5608769.1 response regulator [Rhodovastum atsumiense]CAH2602882.1 Response regulator [Rhodovastum atsumiense]